MIVLHFSALSELPPYTHSYHKEYNTRNYSVSNIPGILLLYHNRK
jgi:hypothetical protein